MSNNLLCSCIVSRKPQNINICETINRKSEQRSYCAASDDHFVPVLSLHTW